MEPHSALHGLVDAATVVSGRIELALLTPETALMRQHLQHARAGAQRMLVELNRMIDDLDRARR